MTVTPPTDQQPPRQCGPACSERHTYDGCCQLGPSADRECPLPPASCHDRGCTTTAAEHTTGSPLTDQQLTDRIRQALNTAVSLPSCPPLTEHGSHTYELGCALCHGDLLVLTRAVVAVVQPEVDRLRADNEQLRDRLANYGSPLRGSAPLPPPDAGAEKQRAMREQLETGITDLAWAVGKALCPAGTKCPAGILAVFWPTKRGRLPIHRDIYGHSCSGSGQKATPLKAAVTTAQES